MVTNPAVFPPQQYVSYSWSWPHQKTHSRRRYWPVDWSTGLWPLFEMLRFMCRGPDLTHILTALSERQRKSFLPEVLLDLTVCIDFNLSTALFKITSAPSLPLIYSKQKIQVVRMKIYSTASTEKKSVELNWIELNWSVTRGLTQYIWCSQITGWCLWLETVLIPESVWSSILPSVWVNINKVWSLSGLFTPPRRI